MALLDNQTPVNYYSNVDLYGEYQFVSLTDIINQFMFVYVGEDKIISKASRVDVAFHAQRGLAEMSFDTLKSTKGLELVISPLLQMTLPQDYVGYVKVSWTDSSGIKHVMQPASKTSNPTTPFSAIQIPGSIYQGQGPGAFVFLPGGQLAVHPESKTWTNYQSSSTNQPNHDDHHHHDPQPYFANSKYGLDPQYAQVNGSFYIDENAGNIHFSSDVVGRTVVLDYISDSLGTDGEMKVHKFAEEAMYKWISHAILSGKSNIPEYQVSRLKKERFAAVRTAKLRLSNLKLEELTQILRGKSKQIKH